MRASSVLVSISMLFAIGCGRPPLSFDSEGSDDASVVSDTAVDSEDTSTEVPPDLAPGDGDGEPPGDGDDAPTGDGDPPGDGDGDPGSTCGNGVIDDGEQCDGNNHGGFGCLDLGYTGGTLQCDPIVCTFDASMCINEDPVWSIGTTG